MKYDKKNTGQIVVEFTLLSGIFMIFLMGVMDYGLYLYAQMNFDNSVRNAVRAAVKMTNWSTNQADNTTTIKAVVTTDCAKLPAFLRNNLNNYITITVDPNVNNIDKITVQIVSYPYTSLTGFADLFVPTTISSTAVMRYLNF